MISQPDPARGESPSRRETTRLEGGVQSVDRAAVILEILAREGRVGVSGIANELGVHKSTASRLLSALETHGLVAKSANRGKYQLGVGILRLAGSISGRLSIVQQARPTLERLADELGETVNLAVRRGAWAVNLDQAMGTSPLTTYDWIGNLTPLHATASGKIFLAELSGAERDDLIGSAPLPRFTGHTLVSRRRLDAELEQVSRAGVAATRDELETGLSALAVGIRDHRDDLVASISVSGPTFRFDPAAEDLIGAVLRGGAEISGRLGHAEAS